MAGVTAPRVLFLGGNGHCAARLAAAREAAGLGLALDEVAYPGFEGRPRARDLEGFLHAIAAADGGPPSVVYATGIGGLIALCLRARGAWAGVRLLLQAPVLWGLEHRLMPRVMRVAPMRRLAGALFATSFFRAAFVRRYFQRRLSLAERAAFFDGYARCAALPDLFTWITPSLLRALEADFAARPAALEGIDVWWGARDRVVTLAELQATETALGVTWPVRVFPHWGHYPMIDAPEDWAAALAAYVQGSSDDGP
jgi:pimeloyl-ACP methyl ester carboxylesterase